MEVGRAKHRVEWYEGIQALSLPSQKTLFGSAFLGVWLVGLVWGGGKAAVLHLQDRMIVLWLVGWAPGAAATTLLLVGQLIGVDIVQAREGELVITRRAGPFARTWRYSAGMIRNLRIDTSKWTGDGLDGAQYVPFTKQQWGSVRFDYGTETIHLAPHVNEPEAVQIVDWLRRRLPISAVSSPTI